jgi:hypothetical protein
METWTRCLTMRSAGFGVGRCRNGHDSPTKGGQPEREDRGGARDAVFDHVGPFLEACCLGEKKPVAWVRKGSSPVFNETSMPESGWRLRHAGQRSTPRPPPGVDAGAFRLDHCGRQALVVQGQPPEQSAQNAWTGSGGGAGSAVSGVTGAAAGGGAIGAGGAASGAAGGGAIGAGAAGTATAARGCGAADSGPGGGPSGATSCGAAGTANGATGSGPGGAPSGATRCGAGGAPSGPIG